MLQQIEEARAGDRQAFEEIVRHYTGMAKSIAYDKLQDIQLAEDAVQEAFTEAFLHLSQLSTAEAFPGWFRSIVVRQCYRILRRKRHATDSFDEAMQMPDPAYNIADIIERNEVRRIVQNTVAGLSSKLRVAVELFYWQGYSLKEISDFLGVSIPVLKKRLFDARHKLKGSLPVADVISVFTHLYEGGTRLLHIVNGDSVGDMLRQGIVHGDILVWREVYPHGPVFPQPAAEDNRTFRAGYLEKTLGVPKAEYLAASIAQEQALDQCGKYDEVVLWFEHDLFDQTMLSYLLHRFSDMSSPPAKLSLLCIGEFPGIELFHGLGQLTREQIATLHGTWTPIGAVELQLGSALWQAYASADPQILQSLLNQDTSALPFAHDAFKAHLSRFPSTSNGLGIVEQTTLERVNAGTNKAYSLFGEVTDSLHRLGMGDLEYKYVLSRMAQAPHPLLEIGGKKAVPGVNPISTPFRNDTVELTELGKEVLEGKIDWTFLSGIDEWYGGVHLQGNQPDWRWNAAMQRIETTGPR
ncbi:sigma-70 family RNA polymerase sigma factor [Paenibacillus sp. sgz500958]|uniref:sigma-70 family RNA polymerase sigma factor n=1 Tax=Paenibacillus sp. sgz500958 TaxID=3242475 RepID=UPI0036D2B7BE